MKRIILAIFFVFANHAVAQSVIDILSKNSGNLSGSAQDDASVCSLEVVKQNDEYRVLASVHFDESLMLYPHGYWEVDVAHAKMIYSDSSKKEDYILFNFDATSLKLNSFAYYHDSGGTPGNSCIF